MLKKECSEYDFCTVYSEKTFDRREVTIVTFCRCPNDNRFVVNQTRLRNPVVDEELAISDACYYEIRKKGCCCDIKFKRDKSQKKA